MLEDHSARFRLLARIAADLEQKAAMTIFDVLEGRAKTLPGHQLREDALRTLSRAWKHTVAVCELPDGNVPSPLTVQAWSGAGVLTVLAQSSLVN